MENLLRDFDREQRKMQHDINQLNRHYDNLRDYLQQYIRSTTIQWAKLLVDHPKAVCVVVETTMITAEYGSCMYNESEPIRATILNIATGEIWDQLLRPTHSQDITGTEYHGLTLADVADQPRLAEAWPSIEQRLAGRHIVIFGAEHARNALRTVCQTRLLDGAMCLHRKAGQYYGEFYDLSLQKLLGYQGMETRRPTDSRERVVLLRHVLENFAAGMEKQSDPEQPAAVESSTDDLDDHPF